MVGPFVGVGDTRCRLFIDQPTSSGDPRRATIKAHHSSTQSPSPLRNPRLGLKLMPIGGPLWSPAISLNDEAPPQIAIDKGVKHANTD